jgi:phosphatidylethanolamine-binding protein (PEBP) family uncharacterized protein
MKSVRKVTMSIAIMVLWAVSGSGCGGTDASAGASLPSGGTDNGVFALASPVAAAGGSLPAAYTCDGAGSTPPLAWSNAPAGTRQFALLMTTLPGDGATKWNWVLYGIPASTAVLPENAVGIGTLGTGSHGTLMAYDPPCSQGPGVKIYTFTLYALSGPPDLGVPPEQVTGELLTDAIAAVTLGTARLDLGYARPDNAVAMCPVRRGGERSLRHEVAPCRSMGVPGNRGGRSAARIARTSQGMS